MEEDAEEVAQGDVRGSETDGCDRDDYCHDDHGEDEQDLLPDPRIILTLERVRIDVVTDYAGKFVLAVLCPHVIHSVIGTMFQCLKLLLLVNIHA